MTQIDSKKTLTGTSPYAHISNEEYGAFLKLRLLQRVPEFANYLKTFRTTASRQLVYDSFGDRRTDSPLLQWVRQCAVTYTLEWDLGTGKEVDRSQHEIRNQPAQL